MIDTKELRAVIQEIGLNGVCLAEINELLDRVEAAEKERDVLRDRLALESQENGALRDSVDRACEERDALRAKIEAMEKQEPTHWACKVLQADASWKEEVSSEVPPSGYFCVRDIKPLYALPGAQSQPAPSVPECPYPCGWQNLLKYAIEDGAYLARSLNEDEPVTENARVVAMRMVLRLRDVLMAVNNAAPEAKP